MLRLLKCQSCDRVQYPKREICGDCLDDALEVEEVDARGSVISWTRLHVSLDPFFNEHGPWLIGLVKLKCGPVVFAHLVGSSPATGDRVWLEMRRDRFGHDVFVAVPEDDDGELRDFSNLFIEDEDDGTT